MVFFVVALVVARRVAGGVLAVVGAVAGLTEVYVKFGLPGLVVFLVFVATLLFILGAARGLFRLVV